MFHFEESRWTQHTPICTPLGTVGCFQKAWIMYGQQRCTGSGFKDSSPAGFTFCINRIGSGLRLYSSFRIRIRIFKFHILVFDANTIIKKFRQRFKGWNVVYINCKCVKEALLHQMCRALQGASPPPHQPISPLSGSFEPLNTAWYQITFVNCGVVEVRDVVLLKLFCCNICFSVHQYQLVPIYLSVRAVILKLFWARPESEFHDHLTTQTSNIKKMYFLC